MTLSTPKNPIQTTHRVNNHATLNQKKPSRTLSRSEFQTANPTTQSTDAAIELKGSKTRQRTVHQKRQNHQPNTVQRTSIRRTSASKTSPQQNSTQNQNSTPQHKIQNQNHNIQTAHYRAGMHTPTNHNPGRNANHTATSQPRHAVPSTN
ncbi:hypothetical protein M758_12G073400 [Ceratodon purpureus]|nr:hypothetical protein M758_12G073400 [Ceratodon purpureus]